MIPVALVALAVSSAALSAPSPLHEIEPGPGTQTVCGNVVVHANAVIAAAVRGDAAIGRAVARLRTIDFDSAGPARRDGLSELAHFANDAGDDATRGGAEIKRLATIAEQSHTAQRDELHAFTSPLANAFELQRKTVADLANFLGSVESSDIRQGPVDPNAGDPLHDSGGSNAHPMLRPAPPKALGQGPGYVVDSRTTLATTARAVANDIENRTNAVTTEESHAAEHAEAAVRGCS